MLNDVLIQGDSMKYQNKHIQAWNSGMTLEEANVFCGEDVAGPFKIFTDKYGCQCITIQKMFKRPFMDPVLSEEYSDWKGTTGLGAQLRRTLR